DHIAADVHQSHLLLSSEHIEVDPARLDVAILNAKGFGGNNASATVLAPHVALRMLEKRHGARAMGAWRERNEAVNAPAAAYDDVACAGKLQPIYKFDHNVMGGDDLDLSARAIAVPGFGQPIDLDLTSPCAGWLGSVGVTPAVECAASGPGRSCPGRSAW